MLARMLDWLRGRKSSGDLSSIPASEYFASPDAWTSVTSSNVKAIAYYGQGKTGLLRVRFLNHSEYQYESVPYEAWDGFLDAPSKGKYLHQAIKGRYSYRKVG